jgi:primosomal protein N' (replication factor Y)
MRVRVLPNVSGLDKRFDYLVPDDAERPGVGDVVRVPLHGRRVTGWVTDVDPIDDAVATERLQPIIAVVSRGPEPHLLELAEWASLRWAAGRLRPFLVTASPPVRVLELPPARRTAAASTTGSVGATAAVALAAGDGLVVLPPAVSPVDAIVAAAAIGPALVVVPAVARAEAMAGALRRRSLSVAVVPNQWPQAAAGVDVVIGGRAAAWAPCPDLAAVVVIDEHDEALQEERAPTWHARDVLVERARHAGAVALLTSPCPTVAGSAAVGDAVSRVPAGDEREGWPLVDVIDRRNEEPWKTSLVSSALIRHLRNDDEIVVCVHNTPGRARVVACRTCKALLRCERCDAAVSLPGDTRLVCPRCGTERARVCQVCGGSSFANLRPGVTRLREELEAASGRPTVAVTGRDATVVDDAGVYVGTEAVLHRVARADVVAFLDFDRELLAPRYRAGEQALALLARAARLLGPRSRGGRLLVQTFLPDHDVIRSVLLADGSRLLGRERVRRVDLQLPPAVALAEVTGEGAAQLVAALGNDPAVSVGGSGSGYLVRADSWEHLGAALLEAKRTSGSRARIAVDPPRA